MESDRWRGESLHLRAGDWQQAFSRRTQRHNTNKGDHPSRATATGTLKTVGTHTHRQPGLKLKTAFSQWMRDQPWIPLWATEAHTHPLSANYTSTLKAWAWCTSNLCTLDIQSTMHSLVTPAAHTSWCLIRMWLHSQACSSAMLPFKHSSALYLLTRSGKMLNVDVVTC